MKPNLTEISKSISYYLRHKPEELSITLDNQGWVDLNEFILKLSDKLKYQIDVDTIFKILEQSPKKRFEIGTEKNKIRALYGHSIKTIDPVYEEIKVIKPLYYGTSKDNLELILNKGLNPQKRLYIHLTDSKEQAILNAKRHSHDVVLLEILADKLIKDNYKIYKGGEHIYLMKYIPNEYIKAIVV